MLVRDRGELVAAAPLMRVRRPVPALVPLGGAISDYGDVLLDDDRGERAVAALTAMGVTRPERMVNIWVPGWGA